jgi:hypothetical protein
MQTQEQTTRVEFTMPPRPLAQLEELSLRTGIRRSDLIRFAVMKLVDRPEVLIGGPTAAAVDAPAAGRQ